MSLHCEKGKKKDFGLTAKQRKNRFSKKRKKEDPNFMRFSKKNKATGGMSLLDTACPYCFASMLLCLNSQLTNIGQPTNGPRQEKEARFSQDIYHILVQEENIVLLFLLHFLLFLLFYPKIYCIFPL